MDQRQLEASDGRLTMCAIVISGTALYLTYRQPEVCSLCGSGNRERYQAPVILNLTTG